MSTTSIYKDASGSAFLALSLRIVCGTLINNQGSAQFSGHPVQLKKSQAFRSYNWPQSWTCR
ncbi:MAG: hypothetical protein IJT77_03600, partial [Clostridia bacterium]|nr:hypothetical protein [Clostridia bacterium]